MIGVIAKPADYEVVSEFFQLFKTPWEFYQDHRRYEVVLCAGDYVSDRHDAQLTLVYHGSRCSFDDLNGIVIISQTKGEGKLPHHDREIPIYGDSITFQNWNMIAVADAKSEVLSGLRTQPQPRTLLRIGYDLFEEVRRLLTVGQPAANATIPTLDLHISFLRDLIVERGILLVEIPPAPDGYRFIACLTHDVDHPSIRLHKFDHTTSGFLYRAVFGSLRQLASGRISLRGTVKNWAAVLKLPLVHMGLAKDCWRGFVHYSKMESGLGSSFFIIPFKDRPGLRGQEPAPRMRASRYGIDDILEEVIELSSEGREIGLHGIDAWFDISSGRNELEAVRQITGAEKIGTRMHWLYFDQNSPAKLEKAGADYDSTVGYNETVGYRAGTAQVYKPLDATTLLELPLHIMDTALFFPSYLNLSATAARLLVRGILDHAVSLGGAVTVNWHDRSIAPERQWGEFYSTLIDDLKTGEAWFPNASQAVSWFRKRRSAVFTDFKSDSVQVKINDDGNERLPALRLRIHNESKVDPEAAGNSADPFRDISLENHRNAAVSLAISQGKDLRLQ